MNVWILLVNRNKKNQNRLHLNSKYDSINNSTNIYTKKKGDKIERFQNNNNNNNNSWLDNISIMMTITFCYFFHIVVLNCTKKKLGYCYIFVW